MSRSVLERVSAIEAAADGIVRRAEAVQWRRGAARGADSWTERERRDLRDAVLAELDRLVPPAEQADAGLDLARVFMAAASRVQWGSERNDVAQAHDVLERALEAERRGVA